MSNVDNIELENIAILYQLNIFDLEIFADRYINYYVVEKIQNQGNLKNEFESDILAHEQMNKQDEENFYRKRDNMFFKNTSSQKYEIFLNKKIISLDPEKSKFTYKEYFDYFIKELELYKLSKNSKINRDYENFKEDDLWKLYYIIHKKYYHMNEETENILSKSSKKLQIYNNRIDEIYEELDSNILFQSSFIAMTTYGAVKYKRILNKINSKVLIVEEAAEVLDCQIITSLSEHTEHLILIGDHKQLRPKINDYNLILNYNFDISLFERLINCNFNQVCLEKQRRMRPEISAITRLTYPELQDGDSVKNRKNIKSLDNIFFFTHSWMEKTDEGTRSKINEKEADFIIKYTELLINLGYKQENISILSLYLGQLLHIRKKINIKKILTDVKVVTVDNYQGEENDIIILSLVRSNKNGNIGFLGIDNRVNVALSRAKNGLYIFGNATVIRDYQTNLKNKKNNKKKTTIWTKILQFMIEKKYMRESITLKCKNHKEEIIVKEIKDFDKCPEGGCRKICSLRMECGHSCKRFCHMYEISYKNKDGHNDLKSRCHEKCDKLHNCDHKCKQKCWICREKGPRICAENVDIHIFKCNHEIKVPCYKKNDKDIFCTGKCEKFLPCWHKCKKKCGEKCMEISKYDKREGYLSPCREMVEIKLKCQHKIKVQCRIAQNEYLSRNLKCKSKCSSKLECGHECSGDCQDCLDLKENFELDFHSGYCGKKCGRDLPCNHVCKDFCSIDNCSPCKAKCDTRCLHNFCPKSCGENCPNCLENCIYQCEHYKCNKQCYEICDRPPCNEKCKKKLKCGHDCIGFCGEECPVICKICDKDHEDFQIFFGTEDEPDAIFVKLDCVHNIESTSLDRLFKLRQENEREVELKKYECPKCKSIINNCMRYQDQIKKINSQFKKAKNIMLKSIKEVNNENLENLKEISKIENEYNNIFKSKRKEISKEVIPLKTKNYSQNNRKSEKINEVNHRILILRRYLKLFNLKNTKLWKGEFIKEIGHILYLINLPFTPKNIKNINKIFKSVDIYCQSKLKIDNITDPNIIGKKIKILNYIKKKNFIISDSELEKIKKEFDCDFFKLKMKKILSALNLGSGHTFCCTICGYIYVIGECGGATQSFPCPGTINGESCKNTLGGGGHQLNANNRHVSDYDGSNMGAYDQAMLDNVIPPEYL